MKLKKENLLLYAVTDRSWVGKKTLYEQIEDALKGGATIIQLREKELDETQFIAEAIEVRKICRKYDVPLIINDNVDVALRSGADGVHVGLDDMPINEIRKKAPENFIIGATAKTVEQAHIAEKSGADYLGIGAVFPSPTKRNAKRITVEQLCAISSSVSIPTVAIGGITFDNVSELANSDIDGIAVVSAVFAADDIQKETALLKEKANAIIKTERTEK